MISLRILIQFSDFWFYGFVFESSFQKYQNSQFLSTFHCLIWWIFKRSLEIIIILFGFDLYSPLYSLIHDYLIKLVNLVIVLTFDRVYSMTLQSRLVTRVIALSRSPVHGEDADLPNLLVQVAVMSSMAWYYDRLLWIVYRNRCWRLVWIRPQTTLEPLMNHPIASAVPMKDFKAGIVEPDLIVDLKGSSSNMSIVKGLRLFLVNHRILVRVVP